MKASAGHPWEGQGYPNKGKAFECAVPKAYNRYYG
jgi:hypothetical protein